MDTTEQIDLLPPKPLKWKFCRIELKDLRRLNPYLGPRPTEQMVESVRKLGIIQPLAIFRDHKGKPRVGDGLRRMEAAHIAELDTVPCMVAENEMEYRALITLAANNQRSANPLAELRAIEQLTSMASIDLVCQATGIPKARVLQRLRLLDLDDDFLKLVRAGEISVTVGEAASKLPLAYQKKLLRLYDKQHHISMTDVRNVKDVRRENATAALPSNIFQMPAPKVDPLKRLRDGLAEMIERGRLTADSIPDDFDWLVQMLDETKETYGTDERSAQAHEAAQKAAAQS